MADKKVTREDIDEALESESWEYAYNKLVELGIPEDEIFAYLDDYFNEEEE